MNWEIALVLGLLLAALVSFALEKVPVDLTALSLFGVLLLTGLLTTTEAFAVFSNPAPLTVGAMFVLSAAMERCGLIDRMAAALEGTARIGYHAFLAVLVVGVAGISAFINNTPVVVVLLPITMTLAKKLGVSPSKLLIPLSYASIFGGVCTLVGTSTNILVSGISVRQGLPPISMFELAQVGVPLLGVGLLYLLVFGRYLLPNRESLTAILSEEERREYLLEAFVQPDSPMVGQPVVDTLLLKNRGVRLVDLVRHGTSLLINLQHVKLEAGDRLILACRPSGVAHARSLRGIDFAAELKLGLEQIAAHEGAIVEGIVGANSALIGQSLASSNFRQHYRMVVLAVHRSGRNLRERFHEIPLQFGDTLLMLGTDAAIQRLRSGDDIHLIDQPRVPAASLQAKLPIVLGTIAAVVAVAAASWAPIELTAILGCLVLFWTRCLTPKDGYQAIQWNILFLIYGMLAMGMAMEKTGTTQFLATNLLQFTAPLVDEAWRPWVALALVYLITTVLTEILSNNAAAVVMATLAIGLAHQLGVDPRPFVVAVAIAASASFATPIGYQTNTYVYGAGGYRFSDFLRVGVPLNLIYFAGAMWLIPKFWPF
jgi:di/tricarboxylate transporter